MLPSTMFSLLCLACMWVALLQKFYAKECSSFQHMRNIFINELEEIDGSVLWGCVFSFSLGRMTQTEMKHTQRERERDRERKEKSKNCAEESLVRFFLRIFVSCLRLKFNMTKQKRDKKKTINKRGKRKHIKNSYSYKSVCMWHRATSACHMF